MDETTTIRGAGHYPWLRPVGFLSIVDVAAVSGYAEIRRTLELPLESVDHRVGPMAASPPDEPEMLERADVLLPAPGRTQETEAAVLAAFVAEARGTAGVSAAEPAADSREARVPASAASYRGIAGRRSWSGISGRPSARRRGPDEEG